MSASLTGIIRIVLDGRQILIRGDGSTIYLEMPSLQLLLTLIQALPKPPHPAPDTAQTVPPDSPGAVIFTNIFSHFRVLILTGGRHIATWDPNENYSSFGIPHLHIKKTATAISLFKDFFKK